MSKPNIIKIMRASKDLNQMEKDYFTSATTHGLGRIYSAQTKLERYFWMLTFMSVFGYLIYSVHCILLKIQAYQVVLETNAKTNSVMIFPAVTVCNANPFRKSKVEELLKSAKIPKEDSEDQFHFLYNLLNSLNKSQLHNLGHPFHDFVIKDWCIFAHDVCSTGLFKTISNPIQGNCFTFNFDGNLRQAWPGNLNGFSFSLNVNQSEYDTYFSMNHMAGAIIIIHPYDSPSTPLSTSTLVSPGQLTRITLKHSKIKRLPHPYPANCVSINSETGGHNQHTPQLCALDCFAKAEKKACGSVSPLFHSYLKSIFHSTDVYINSSTMVSAATKNCWHKYEEQFKAGKVPCNCQILCEEETFETTVSSAIWPSKVFSRKLLEYLRTSTAKYGNVTKNMISENILKVEIFFDDFSTYELKQIPAYDVNSFMSDLGGQLGLCIGASIFSVLELGAFVGKLISYYFSKRKQKNKLVQISEFSTKKGVYENSPFSLQPIAAWSS